MNTSPFFSVIIAAYNAEKYITKTIKSVLDQTFCDFELIVVDDGSKDNTAEIVNGFIAKDDRVKLIKQQNSGPSSARNNGILNSKGRYLYIIDSDDLVEADALKSFYEIIKLTNSPVVASGYIMEVVNQNSTKLKTFNHEFFIADSRSDFLDKLPSLMKEHLMYVAWNKVYLRQMIIDNNIKFRNYSSCEDRLFNIDVFNVVESFAFIDTPTYHYFYRGNASLVNKYLPDKLESLEVFYSEVVNLYKKNSKINSDNLSLFSFLFLKGVLACLVTIYSSTCPLNKKEKNEYIKSVLNNETVNTAISHCKEGGFSFRIINVILKSRIVWLNKFLAFLINFTSVKASSLLLKIKHGSK